MIDPLLNRAPETIRHIHIMGICGTAMAALAGMLLQSGFRITGSDRQVYPPMSEFLTGLGIEICNGYAPENLLPRPDLVIVGNVITRVNPEALALAEARIPYLSLPQALAHFYIGSRTSLVVAGTHGKTTTSSLLASSLHRANLDPTFMIGGIVREFGGNFRIGNGQYFVAEGDEYDTAFFDKGSKFLHYQPRIAILTSIEFDHADIFADLGAIMATFRRFVRLIPSDGLLVACLDDPNVAEIAGEARCPVQGYGFAPDLTWSLGDIRIKEGMTAFSVSHHGKHWGDMAVRLPGRHNCLNSLAVTAVLHHIGVERQQIADGLANFGGVKRRQEVRGMAAGITVIDDFAHHPTAVRETLAALKAAYAGRRLVAVFEPRTNSSRRAVFQQDYVRAFAAADSVLLREPLPLPGVAAEELFSSAQLADDLRRNGQGDVCSFPDTDTLLAHLEQSLRNGDVVAILSNGGFDNIHVRLLECLQKREAAR